MKKLNCLKFGLFILALGIVSNEAIASINVYGRLDLAITSDDKESTISTREDFSKHSLKKLKKMLSCSLNSPLP